MNKVNLSKSTIAGIVAALIIVAFVFYSCVSGSSDDKKSTSQQDSIFSSTTTTRVQQTSPQKTVSTTTEPYSRSDQASLEKHSTTGSITPTLVHKYLSPRWNTIINGDASEGTGRASYPLSEIDKASNSDLDETTFSISRQTAIDVVKAEMTSEGSSKWPAYFQGTTLGQCTKFKANHAGATSLPIPNDYRWVMAYVFWEAKCGSGSSTTALVTKVYFSVDNGALTPRRIYELPQG